MEALAGASAGPAGVGRRQFLRPLANTRVIDGRRGLPTSAWARARRANQIYDRLLPWLKGMLVALGPDADVRAQFAAEVVECSGWMEAPRGWGPAVQRSRAGYGTNIVPGLSLAVDAGDHAIELVWLLDVLPSRQDVRNRMRGPDFPDWCQSKGKRGWFTTRVGTTRGQPSLTKAE